MDRVNAIMASATNAPDQASLRGLTVLVSGGSRGIGLAVAKRCARDGANVIIAAKTADPHPKSVLLSIRAL